MIDMTQSLLSLEDASEYLESSGSLDYDRIFFDSHDASRSDLDDFVEQINNVTIKEMTELTNNGETAEVENETEDTSEDEFQDNTEDDGREEMSAADIPAAHLDRTYRSHSLTYSFGRRLTGKSAAANILGPTIADNIFHDVINGNIYNLDLAIILIDLFLQKYNILALPPSFRHPEGKLECKFCLKTP